MTPGSVPFDAAGLDRRRQYHFNTLNRDEQAQAIRRMAASGHGDDTIAVATGLSREMIRRVLAERAA